MTKTFIIVVIVLAIIAYMLYNQNYSTTGESFGSVDNGNTNGRQLTVQNSSETPNNYASNNTNNCVQNNTYPTNEYPTNTTNNVNNYDETDNSNDSESSANVKEDDNGLVINDSVVSYDNNTQESDDRIRKKIYY